MLLIIVVVVLFVILWYWYILCWVIKSFVFVFKKGMGLGGVMLFVVLVNVFMGMMEVLVLVKLYFKGMFWLEIFILMVVGFVIVVGSVLVFYGVFLKDVLLNVFG